MTASRQLLYLSFGPVAHRDINEMIAIPKSKAAFSGLGCAVLAGEFGRYAEFSEPKQGAVEAKTYNAWIV